MRNDGWKPQISNPQSNPQFAMSYTTRRYFGSPRSRDRSLRNTGARFRALVRSLEEERQLSQEMCASTNLISSSAARSRLGPNASDRRSCLVTTDPVQIRKHSSVGDLLALAMSLQAGLCWFTIEGVAKKGSG